MKVEVKKVDNIKRELTFEIPKDRVSQKLDEVYKEIGKAAKIKGFRSGKVPRNILEQKHGERAKEEVVQQLIPEVYQEGIVQEKLFPVDYPAIADVSFKDGIITFKATLDVKPEVKLKEYKGIKVKRKSSKVTDEDVNKTLEMFSTAQGKDKEKLKIDDAFAKGLGYPSLEEFKNTLKSQIQVDKDRQVRQDTENQVIDAILKVSKLDVPQSIVDKQLEKRVQEYKKHLEQQGMKKEDIENKENEMRKKFRPNVEKDIKAYFVFEKIAELEEIEIKEGEQLPQKVMEFLLKEAKWEGDKDGD